MANEAKKRPSLSVLLALKGLVPLEADCTDRLVSMGSKGVVVHRYYQGNPDFVREIKLPPNSVSQWEYEETPFEKTYSRKKGKFLYKPIP